MTNLNGAVFSCYYVFIVASLYCVHEIIGQAFGLAFTAMLQEECI